MLLSPSLLFPYGRDQGVFTDVAQTILRGGAPYRDIWDIKPPGIYLVYTAIVGLFGPRIAAARAVDLVSQSITVALLFALGRRLVGREAAAVGALGYAALYLHTGYWSMAQAEGFAALPTVVAFTLALRARRGSAAHPSLRRSLTFCAAGLLCGWVALLKFTLILPCLVGVLWAATASDDVEQPAARRAPWAAGTPSLTAHGAQSTARRSFPVVGRWSLVFLPIALGVALPLAGALVYLHFTGAWTAYLEIQRGFVLPYARFTHGGETWPARAWGGLRAFVSDYWFPCLLAAIGAASIARRRLERQALPLLGWLILTVVGVAIQGKYFGYHWIPALMPLALLAGTGLLSPRSRHLAQRSPFVGLLCVALWSGIRDWPAYRDGWRVVTGGMARQAYEVRFGPPQAGDYSYVADRWVADYLRATTRPEDGIFVWGFEPLVYVLAGRQPPTRFHFAVPLVSPGTPDAWRHELLRDLEARPPVLFLVLRNDAIPWASGRSDDSQTQLRRFPELDRFLRRNYRFEIRIEDFAVFRRAKMINE
jgi:hypothetical protein